MSESRHRIKRQVIELTVAGEDEAALLHAEMGRIHERQLLPLIDRCCTELSDPDRIYRIDRLEVDLGTVDPENLEQDIVARAATPLRSALAAQIGQAEQSAGGEDLATRSSLELFEFFARTGSLPWWADISQPRLLDEVLERLLQTAPEPLVRSMRALANEDGSLKRLVLHYPDVLLTRLVLVLVPGLSGMPPDYFTELVDLLQGASGSASQPRARPRTSVWTAIMRTACRDRIAHTEPARFWREAVLQLAVDSGETYAALASSFYQSVGARDALAGGPLGAIATRLYQDLADAPRETPTEAQSASADEPNPLDLVFADVLREAVGESQPEWLEQQDPLDLTFSDADELYVANAGLVLLWPFLENFFDLLGLIEDKEFRDDAAAQRAVGLLQYIAGEDQSPPETLLPLNKVLCGISPDTIFDFGPEITAQEMEECNDLLVAVIQQAPILNEMSLAGFRGSFLLRNGQLGARDGNWLLRVERETHDIVLDRFPWSVQVVKLPWMEAMMQVEW